MENPGHPVAILALRDIEAKRSFQPLVTTPAEGVAEALFGIAASLNDRRSVEVAILYLNITLYLRPNFDLARVLLASHYERMDNYGMANTFYQRIPTASPYCAMTQIQAAINDGRLGQHDAGVAKLRSLVDARLSRIPTPRPRSAICCARPIVSARPSAPMTRPSPD